MSGRMAPLIALDYTNMIYNVEKVTGALTDQTRYQLTF